MVPPAGVAACRRWLATAIAVMVRGCRSGSVSLANTVIGLAVSSSATVAVSAPRPGASLTAGDGDRHGRGVGEPAGPSVMV